MDDDGIWAPPNAPDKNLDGLTGRLLEKPVVLSVTGWPAAPCTTAWTLSVELSQRPASQCLGRPLKKPEQAPASKHYVYWHLASLK